MLWSLTCVGSADGALGGGGTGGHRFAFNGHEIDPEISEQGSVVSFGDYGYSSVLGRRWRVDPLAGGMPTVSPYSYAYNNPVVLKDPDGKLPIIPFLLKAGAAGATDMLLQVAMVYLTDDNVESISQAFEKVDWGDVAISAAQRALPWSVPGGKLGKAAAAATGDVVINAGKKAVSGESYNVDEAAADFFIGFVAQLGAEGADKLLKSRRAIQKLTQLIGEGNVRKLLGRAPFRTPSESHSINTISSKTRFGGGNRNTSKTVAEGNINLSADVAEINSGKAKFNNETNEYLTSSGRVYGIHDSTSDRVFPKSGPGLVSLTQAEFGILTNMIDSGGLIGKAQKQLNGLLKSGNKGVSSDSRDKLIKLYNSRSN